MKTFDELYEELQSANNSELNNALQEAQKERKKSKKITIIVCLTIDIIVGLLVFNKGIQVEFLFPMIMPIFVINLLVFIITYVLLSKNLNIYKAKYKKMVIEKIMGNFYNNLEYFPEKPMPEYIYKEPKYEYYNRYKSEDYFEAQIDNRNSIQMADVLSQKVETYRDLKGRTHTRTITKFHGLFAKIVMNKSKNHCFFKKIRVY